MDDEMMRENATLRVVSDDENSGVGDEEAQLRRHYNDGALHDHIGWPVGKLGGSGDVVVNNSEYNNSDNNTFRNHDFPEQTTPMHPPPSEIFPTVYDSSQHSRSTKKSFNSTNLYNAKQEEEEQKHQFQYQSKIQSKQNSNTSSDMDGSFDMSSLYNYDASSGILPLKQPPTYSKSTKTTTHVYSAKLEGEEEQKHQFQYQSKIQSKQNSNTRIDMDGSFDMSSLYDYDASSGIRQPIHESLQHSKSKRSSTHLYNGKRREEKEQQNQFQHQSKLQSKQINNTGFEMDGSFDMSSLYDYGASSGILPRIHESSQHSRSSQTSSNDVFPPIHESSQHSRLSQTSCNDVFPLIHESSQHSRSSQASCNSMFPPMHESSQHSRSSQTSCNSTFPPIHESSQHSRATKTTCNTTNFYNAKQKKEEQQNHQFQYPPKNQSKGNTRIGMDGSIDMLSLYNYDASSGNIPLKQPPTYSKSTKTTTNLYNAKLKEEEKQRHQFQYPPKVQSRGNVRIDVDGPIDMSSLYDYDDYDSFNNKKNDAYAMKKQSTTNKMDVDGEKKAGVPWSNNATTHRMRSRMNHRRRLRRGYDSDEDSDDDDDDDYDDSDDDDSDDGGGDYYSRTRRRSTSSTRSGNYNAVGAVAVYSSGVLVSQSPAVLTQHTKSEQQRHEEESLQSSGPTINADSFLADRRISGSESLSTFYTRESSRNITNSSSSMQFQQQQHGSSLIDAAVEHTVSGSIADLTHGSTLPEDEASSILVNDNSGENADGEHQKAKKLPWYRCPVFYWSIVGTTVLLTTILVLLFVFRDKKEKPVPIAEIPILFPSATPSPSTTPTASPSTTPTAFPTIVPPNPIKAKAFEQYIIAADITSPETWKNQSSPQHDAYLWLMRDDGVVQYSQTMTNQNIELMRIRYILAVFYYALNGDEWNVNTGWLSDKTHCGTGWKFVSCLKVGDGADETGNFVKPVVGLRIENNNLNGSLPSELAHLSELQYLLLSDNRIQSVEGIGTAIDSLKYLRLAENPELLHHASLFSLTNLQQLYLKNTGFEGTLPSQLQGLSKLTDLDLSDNRLTGTLTDQFKTMSRLQYIVLDFNELEGNLDDILNCGSCASTLETFRSDRNPLTGSLPDRLFDFSALEFLSVSRSGVSGSIPARIGELTALTHLDIFENLNMDGSLPTEIGALVNLQELDVSEWSLTGTVADQFSRMPRMETLRIGETLLEGSIPAGVCEFVNLRRIEHPASVNCTCPGIICREKG